MNVRCTNANKCMRFIFLGWGGGVLEQLRYDLWGVRMFVVELLMLEIEY